MNDYERTQSAIDEALRPDAAKVSRLYHVLLSFAGQPSTLTVRNEMEAAARTAFPDCQWVEAGFYPGATDAGLTVGFRDYEPAVRVRARGLLRPTYTWVVTAYRDTAQRQLVACETVGGDSLQGAVQDMVHRLNNGSYVVDAIRQQERRRFSTTVVVQDGQVIRTEE